MTAIESASLNAFETLADWGTWFVIVGVAGEGIEIGLKIRKHKTKNKKFLSWYGKHEFCLEIWGGVFWVLVVGGLAMEFKGNHNAQQIVKMENTRVAKQAGDAIERASKLDLARVELEKKTEELRAGKISAFRQISPEGANFITAKLKSLGHIDVELIRDIYPSNEGNILTAQIASIFTNAGCNLMSKPPLPRKTQGVVFIWNREKYERNWEIRAAITTRFAEELGEQDPNEFLQFQTNSPIDLIVVIGHRTLF